MGTKTGESSDAGKSLTALVAEEIKPIAFKRSSRLVWSDSCASVYIGRAITWVNPCARLFLSIAEIAIVNV